MSARTLYTSLCCSLFTSFLLMLLLLVYFFINFFILMLLLYFSLFIDHVNKSIIFVFRAFNHHFKNTISIFITVFLPLHSYIHSYIIWSLHPFSQYSDLASRITYVVHVNFYTCVAVLRTTDFIEKIFYDKFFYSQGFCQKSAEKVSEDVFFLILFYSWPRVTCLQVLGSNYGNLITKKLFKSVHNFKYISDDRLYL